MQKKVAHVEGYGIATLSKSRVLQPQDGKTVSGNDPVCRDVKFDKGGGELRKAKNVYCTEYNIVTGDDNFVNVGMIPLDFEKDSKYFMSLGMNSRFRIRDDRSELCFVVKVYRSNTMLRVFGGW